MLFRSAMHRNAVDGLGLGQSGKAQEEEGKKKAAHVDSFRLMSDSLAEAITKTIKPTHGAANFAPRCKEGPKKGWIFAVARCNRCDRVAKVMYLPHLNDR